MIKGMLEATTTSTVNLVNADLLAKERGLRIIESTVPDNGKVRALLSTIVTSLDRARTPLFLFPMQHAHFDHRMRVLYNVLRKIGLQLLEVWVCG